MSSNELEAEIDKILREEIVSDWEKHQRPRSFICSECKSAFVNVTPGSRQFDD
jgi:hypothetical protein